MGVPKYNQTVMKTEEGKTLYSRWLGFHNKDNCGDAFKDFMAFYKWAMKNGFRYGLALRRYDNDEPYSPDNCYWEEFGSKQSYSYTDKSEVAVSIKRFNDTVNKIRKACGMEPLEIKSEETQNKKGE